MQPVATKEIKGSFVIPSKQLTAFPPCLVRPFHGSQSGLTQLRAMEYDRASVSAVDPFFPA